MSKWPVEFQFDIFVKRGTRIYREPKTFDSKADEDANVAEVKSVPDDGVVLRLKNITFMTATCFSGALAVLRGRTRLSNEHGHFLDSRKSRLWRMRR